MNKTEMQEESAKLADGEYCVERVLDHRVLANGSRIFLLKWLNYEDKFNSWEAEEDIAVDLITTYYEQSKNKESQKLEAEAVIGVTEISGKIMFLIKWIGEDKADLITCDEASMKYPQVVIKYFEEKLSWHPRPDTSSVDNEHCAIDKILDVRIKSKGEKEYFVKWVGHGDKENSWVLEECIDKIHLDTFEKHKKESFQELAENLIGKDVDEVVHGFDRGLEPGEIIGATNSSGPLLFLMKWAGVNEADLVPSHEANIKCPQIVIKFYLEKLTLHSKTF